MRPIHEFLLFGLGLGLGCFGLGLFLVLSEELRQGWQPPWWGLLPYFCLSKPGLQSPSIFLIIFYK